MLLPGPVFWFDFVRLARRGRFALFRAGYATLLLGVLFGTYTGYFGLDFSTGLASLMDEQATLSNEQARFAATFFDTRR